MAGLLCLVSLNALADTYPATKQYKVQVGDAIGAYLLPTTFTSFAAAGQAAWNEYQIPSFMPYAIKLDWFVDNNCQSKEEPVFSRQSQSYYQGIHAYLGYSGSTVTQCSFTFNYVFIGWECPYGGVYYDGQCVNAPPCTPPTTRNPATGKCDQETYTLTLTPESATIEPSKTYSFTATVTKQDGGAPSKPVPVSVKVEVDPTSGGHDGTHTSPRPKGSVSPADGTNSFPITFGSTEVSGIHTITATCDECTNGPQTATVYVKISGLSEIPASPFYVLEEADPNRPGKTKPIGATDNHKNNHYATQTARTQLFMLAFKYYKAINPGKRLYINDASLTWGGLMDDDGNWAPPHSAHRLGDAIDIRADSVNKKDGEIPLSLFAKVQDLKTAKMEPEIHCYTSTGGLVMAKAANPAACNGLNRGRHFHVIFR